MIIKRRRQTERQQQQQSQRRRRKKGGDAHLSVLCNQKKCPATTNNIRNDGYFRSTLVIKSQHVILHISALLSNADQTQAGWGKWKRQRFHSGEAAGGSPSSLFFLSLSLTLLLLRLLLALLHCKLQPVLVLLLLVLVLLLWN